MASIEKLKEMIEPITKKENVNLYDVVWVQEGSMKILQVSILDNEGKMDIDTCAKVSSLISEQLDVDDLISFEYYLEVCSPGAERELRSDEEMVEALNTYVYVKLTNAKEGLDEVQGYLREVNEETLKIEYLAKTIKKSIEIEKDNINLIRLAVKI